MTEHDEEFLTAGTASALVGVSSSTLRRAVDQGLLAGWHTPGRHLRIARSACVEFARSLGQGDLVGRLHDQPVLRVAPRADAAGSRTG